MSEKSFGDEKTLPPDSGGEKGYSLAAGDVLGDYVVVKPLGRGGMGQVYVAENRVTGRQVALKVIADAAARGADFVERFRQEARVMSELDHPGIVRVHHAGEDRGRFYLTMDLVEGGTLEDFFTTKRTKDTKSGREGPTKGTEDTKSDSVASLSSVVDESELREIAVQILEALGYAHGKGIVHRDLKPANILVEVQGSGFKVQGWDGEAGGKTLNGGEGGTLNLKPKIKITDFGLAKVVGEEFVSEMVKKSVSLSLGGQISEGRGQDVSMGEVETKVTGSSKRPAYEGTSTGAILGTYDYMSPEQKAGAAVTAQSDLYSFGVILYKLLTGRKPEGRAKAVSHFGVSAEWDAIVDKCLEVDFLDRYASVDEVLADLKCMGLGAGGRGKRKKTANGRKSTRIRGDSHRGAGARRGVGRKVAGWGLVVGCLLLVGGWWGWEEMGRRSEVRAAELAAFPSSINAIEGVSFINPYDEHFFPVPYPGPLVVSHFEISPAGTQVRFFNDGYLYSTHEVSGNGLELQSYPGTYDLKIQKDGYRALTQTVEVGEEGYKGSFTLSPLRGVVPESGSVRVVLEVPEYAEDYLRKSKTWVQFGPVEDGLSLLPEGQKEVVRDGIAVGITEVEVVNSGFQKVRASSIEVRAGETTEVTLPLEPLPARVTLSGAPAGASVRLRVGSDMYDVSDLSDVAVPSLQEGVLEVSAPGHETVQVTVPGLNPGERRELPVALAETQGPAEGQEWTSPTTSMAFVWIKDLKMWVGKYEVTNGEYRKFKRDHTSREYHGHSLNGDRQPAVYVTFDEAKAYAVWIAEQDLTAGRLPVGYRYRLPTGEEWKRFATAGNNWEYPWGKNWPPVNGRAGNYADMTSREKLNFSYIKDYRDGHAVSAPVEQSWVNPWGLYGVGGNVWEMVAKDAANSSFAAWRGASWVFYNPDHLRISYHFVRPGSQSNYDGGFRLVLEEIRDPKIGNAVGNGFLEAEREASPPGSRELSDEELRQLAETEAERIRQNLGRRATMVTGNRIYAYVQNKWVTAGDVLTVDVRGETYRLKIINLTSEDIELEAQRTP